MTQQALIDTSAPARVPLRELEDGAPLAGVFAVRERELRRKRNGEAWLRLVLGDASGAVEAVSWEDAEARYALAGPGSAVFVTGTFEVSDRWGSKIKVAELREAELQEYRAADLAPASRRLLRAPRERPAGAARDDPAPAAAGAARAFLRRRCGDLGALPRGPGGEGLPPGLPSRAARAHPLRRPGGQRRRRLLPGHRPRRCGQRRAAARHRQDRGLQR